MKRIAKHPSRLPIAAFVDEIVALSGRVLSKEEQEARAGGGATAWRSSTPVSAELGIQFMEAEQDEIEGLDFTASDLAADKGRINELERGKAACEQAAADLDRALAARKERLAGRVGRLQAYVQAQAPGRSGSFRANAQPLLAYSAKLTDKQTDRRRETTDLRTSLSQLSAEQELKTRIERGDKLTIDDLRPLAARVARRPRRPRR